MKLFQREKSYFRWNPEAKPKIGRDETQLAALKFNLDGSWVEGTKDGAVAGMCRDSNGVVVDGFVKSVRASSVIEVETLALQQTLQRQAGQPLGAEVADPGRKAWVDSWWQFVRGLDKGCDDPLINPFADGAAGVEGLACKNVLVIVSEKDILRDRGRMYYKKLVESGRVHGDRGRGSRVPYLPPELRGGQEAVQTRGLVREQRW
ncbi:tuliposide A-converting enzyme 1, chloroplastic-like [Eucalyptus grandis]|uniref:tuliposide A-converting enzyme 1, chloroplastic-like n=1 Tax=Eucalyptus grandis TaxID=71139 RepID=UPI00192EE4F1|nr:tuliposide A-converting enzyme 1, chloroplastic-like [Eucalyptus grandis]